MTFRPTLPMSPSTHYSSGDGRRRPSLMARAWVVAAVAAAFGVSSAVARANPDAPSDRKWTLQLATGAAYLRESWNPNDGNAGSVQRGWAPALEVAAGRTLHQHLVVGAVWQIAAAFGPEESFAGTAHELKYITKIVNMLGAFAEHPLPLRALRVGIALGGVASTTRDDAYQHNSATRMGLGLSPYVGYDRPMSSGWSVGVLARLILYRASFNDTPSSATSAGIWPSLLITASH